MSTRASAAAGDEEQFVPVYYRIQQRLRTTIAAGDLKAGDRLPSESDLCSEFSTTRSTVRHALSFLVYEGLIVREIGRGTFVAPSVSVTASLDTGQSVSFEEQVAAYGAKVVYREPSLTRRPGPKAALAQMSLPAGTDVYVVERLRVIDERAVGHEIRYIRPDLGERVTWEMVETRPVHDFLSEIIGEKIPTTSVFLYVESADARLARRLDIKEGSPMLVREHSYHDREGRTLQCGVSTFRGDMRLSYTLGQPLPAADASRQHSAGRLPRELD
ncbi:GntR family transcriptional regulator [Roseitranquillus sediminis]|uniref:GntR family transcriptional regulator n=1 Tax=Roseitranquillus sediminis TaxID=2809051 RepID=UPI001D0C8A5A|nr:GntR family transcriptional regulator [Roseitranquillus sediminis]MBM9593876.1 GntR family transcriptional regulator [Roseitranquillus sediminis]